MLNVGRYFLNLIFIATLALPTQAFAKLSDSQYYSNQVYDRLMKILPATFVPADGDILSDQISEQQKEQLQRHMNAERPFDLLGIDTPEIRYPPFPRTWVQYDLIKNVQTSTSFGFQVSDLNKFFETFGKPFLEKLIQEIPVLGLAKFALNAGFGANYDISYTYSYKTSFIAMTSVRPLNNGGAQNAPRVSEAPYAQIPDSAIGNQPHPNLRSIINFDPEVKRAYFKTSQEYPIVGFCMYEVSLQIGTTTGGKVDYIIGSHSQNHEEVQRFAYAMYSNFFQVESQIPIGEYLRTKCKGDFEKAVRFVVESDFNSMVAEFNAHYNPQNTCKLPDDPRNLDPKGDSSCAEWFSKLQTSAYAKQKFVPRCEQGRSGRVMCTMKAKKDASCPLYNRRDGSLSESHYPIWTAANTLATSDVLPSVPCDKGLTCTLTDERPMLMPWGAPYAYCK